MEPSTKTRYATILMDPPWLERGAGKIKRGADRHYPLVATKDMPLVIARSGEFRPAEHAHLWMWVTNNYLPDALWLGGQLGFKYKTNVAWIKTADPADVVPHAIAYSDDNSVTMCDLSDLGLQIGIGQYLRGSHELLLFFTRGKGQHESVWNGHHDVPSVIRARRTKHSKKPTASYDLIERVSKGPYLEMFARSEREGWDSWGNHVESV